MSLSLFLSEACKEVIAASMSSHQADLSQAHCLAVSRPKLSGSRSASTVLSQICLGLPVLHCQCLGGSRIQNAGQKSSEIIFTGVGTTEVTKDGKERQVLDSIWHERLSRTRPKHIIGDKMHSQTSCQLANDIRHMMHKTTKTTTEKLRTIHNSLSEKS